MIQQWLEIAQSRHKSYVDIRRRGLEFFYRGLGILEGVSNERGNEVW